MEEEWFKAARAGDDKRAAELLAEQPNLIEATNQRLKNTALHYAAQAGHEAVVARLLTAQPALLHATNTFDWVALDLAAANGHDKLVAQMLAIDVVGLDISRALYQAASGKHDKVVDLLLVALSHQTVQSCTHRMFLRKGEVGAFCSQKAFTQLLAISPPDLIDGHDHGCTVLHDAAGKGHDNLVSQILTLRPQMIGAVTYDGCNVLMYAVEGGHQNTAENLLAIKPELISHVLEDGNTLHYAVKGCKDAEFVAKLWRLNPQALTHANKDSETPFSLAVELKKHELVELFHWSLPFDDIVSAFTRHNRNDWQEKYRPVMERLCESLFVSLGRDVAGTVLEYVGIDVAKRDNKHTLKRTRKLSQ